jgi:hypothetical protein
MYAIMLETENLSTTNYVLETPDIETAYKEWNKYYENKGYSKLGYNCWGDIRGKYTLQSIIGIPAWDYKILSKYHENITDVFT